VTYILLGHVFAEMALVSCRFYESAPPRSQGRIVVLVFANAILELKIGIQSDDETIQIPVATIRNVLTEEINTLTDIAAPPNASRSEGFAHRGDRPSSAP
jgi:hypothetical protein